jgi:hypothetical protein
MAIVNIDGEVIDVTITDSAYVTVSDGKREWYVFQDRETAGQEAAEYWRNMAEYDQGEFATIVGENTLIDWCLGNYAGPGDTKVPSIEDWFELWENAPEDQWATDMVEREGTLSKQAQEEIGFDEKEVVFYRYN